MFADWSLHGLCKSETGDKLMSNPYNSSFQKSSLVLSWQEIIFVSTLGITVNEKNRNRKCFALLSDYSSTLGNNWCTWARGRCSYFLVEGHSFPAHHWGIHEAWFPVKVRTYNKYSTTILVSIHYITSNFPALQYYHSTSCLILSIAALARLPVVVQIILVEIPWYYNFVPQIRILFKELPKFSLLNFVFICTLITPFHPCSLSSSLSELGLRCLFF